MGRAVLADPDAIVRPDVDDRQVHHRRQAHRRTHIVGEYQEGAAVGNHAAVQRQPVENTAHRVLAHPEAEVAPGGGLALKVGIVLEQRDVGGGQVGRAADERGQGRSERVQHRAGGFARGQWAVGGGKGGQRLRPSIGQLFRPQRLQERGLLGVRRPVRLKGLAPPGLCLRAVLDRLPEHRQHLIRDEKVRVGRPAQRRLRQAHLLLPQRRTVGAGCILLVGAAVADVGVADDERGALRLRLRGADGRLDSLQIVPVHFLHVPAVGAETGRDVLGEGNVGRALDGDVVVVVEVDEFAQTQVAGQGGGLVAHPLHQVAVGDDAVGKVVKDGKAGPVEGGGQETFGDCHPHPVGEALSQRAGGGLNARGAAVFGVAGRATPPLAKVLQFLQRQVVAGEVK